MATRWRKAQILTLAIIAPVLIYRQIPYEYRVHLWQLDSAFNELRFDPKGWAEHKYLLEGHPRIVMRALMVDDLMNNHLRKGMTKKEVKSLLGESMDDYLKQNMFRYYLGFTCGPLCMDPDMFYVKFDSQDRVTDFGVHGT